MTDRKLLVSAGPHVRGGASTTSVMGDVLIALLPAVVASVLVFGTRALLLEVVCVAASILFEYLFRKITKRTNTISDLSAAVTGLLLAMNLPAGFPIWMAIVGCFVAIVIVKQLFGGIGCNFANPAITGRIFLLIAFAGQMTTCPNEMFGTKMPSITSRWICRMPTRSSAASCSPARAKSQASSEGDRIIFFSRICGPFPQSASYYI